MTGSVSCDRIVLDSFALLRFFQKEEGHETVADILSGIEERGARVMLNVINLGEIAYIVQRRLGERRKMETLMHVRRLGVEILPAPERLVFRAAGIKARYPLSYADAFVVASAVEQGASIVTGDPEFRAVAHLAPVTWL